MEIYGVTQKNNLSAPKKASKKTNNKEFDNLITETKESEESNEVELINTNFTNQQFNQEKQNQEKAVNEANEIIKELKLIQYFILNGEKNEENLSKLENKLQNLPLLFDPKLNKIIEELKTIITVEKAKLGKK